MYNWLRRSPMDRLSRMIKQYMYLRMYVQYVHMMSEYNLVEAHCYSIHASGWATVEQSHSSGNRFKTFYISICLHWYVIAQQLPRAMSVYPTTVLHECSSTLCTCHQSTHHSQAQLVWAPACLLPLESCAPQHGAWSSSQLQMRMTRWVTEDCTRSARTSSVWTPRLHASHTQYLAMVNIHMYVHN